MRHNMPIKFSILKCLLLPPANEVVERKCFQLCVFVSSQGPSFSPLIQGLVPTHPPPRHVQTYSTWTSLYRDSWICSNLFIMDLINWNHSPLPSETQGPHSTRLNLFIVKRGLLTSGQLTLDWNAFLFHS